MADRPILFSAPMVRALIAGTKTQTRRILNPQPTSHVWRHGWERGKGASWSDGTTTGKLRIWAGDRLYVREAWRTAAHLDKFAPKILPVDSPVFFEADAGGEVVGATGKFRQGMHMPRWASRITLIVTDVRVERLQDISIADAKAEGVFVPEAQFSQQGEVAPRLAYAALWGQINGDGAWDANPWVVAYSFRCIHQNIDEIEKEAA